ncbi:MAG: hypothetical protein VXW28_08180, partial [Candidatus Thermoplasmatota archaeon]|nr:hypothetical protein [Candidatus Thermoplasmatota archaeon]
TLGECGGAADNVLDLAKAQGGMLDISRQYGSGDVVLLYDAINQGWAVTVVDATPEINEMLSVDAPGSLTVSNDAPGVGFPWTDFLSYQPSGSWSTHTVDSAFVVGADENMRVRVGGGTYDYELSVYVDGAYQGGANTWYTFGPGTYNIQLDDSWGDGSNGATVTVQKEAARDAASLSTY